MSVYKVTRSKTYLMHKRTGPVKQKDLDGDGKLEWTEYGKAWRREQYRAQNEDSDYRIKGTTLQRLGKAASEAWDEDGNDFMKKSDAALKETTKFSNEIDKIASDRAYDKERNRLRDKAKGMSDEELQKTTRRLNLEKSYADAVMNSAPSDKGKITVGKVMSAVSIGAGLVTAIGTAGLVAWEIGKKVVNKLGEKKAKDTYRSIGFLRDSKGWG